MVEAKTGQVFIKDILPNIFKEMLHYIYSGRTATGLTEITAQPLYVAAETRSRKRVYRFLGQKLLS